MRRLFFVWGGRLRLITQDKHKGREIVRDEQEKCSDFLWGAGNFVILQLQSCK